MTCSPRLSQWTEDVSRHLPQLSCPQARVLALWSFGMVFVGACGITQISTLLALLQEVSSGTVRQRFREWLYGAQEKQGKKPGRKRREVEVCDCFGPLLRWVLEHWPQSERQVALALDATTLGQRFTVLCISVLVRDCAIPVAWKVLPYNQKGSWQPHWEGLLEALRGSIPAEWTVLVLADRGLYALWLYQQIVALGWQPFLRINLEAKARLEEHSPFVWIKQWVLPLGEQWAGRVECFAQKKSRLWCTLVIRQLEGYEQPWVIVTDLPPDEVEGAWYRMRYWIGGGASRISNGGAGAGSTPRCSMPGAPNAGGWRWRWRRCGRSQWGERLRYNSPPADGTSCPLPMCTSEGGQRTGPTAWTRVELSDARTTRIVGGGTQG